MKVPYAHPIDVRCLSMTNDQKGLKLAGSDLAIVGTGAVKIYGQADVESAFGIKVGDIVKITTGDHIGEYPISHIRTVTEPLNAAVKSSVLIFRYADGYAFTDLTVDLYYKSLTAATTLNAGDIIRFRNAAGFTSSTYNVGEIVSVTATGADYGKLQVKWSFPVPMAQEFMTVADSSNPAINFTAAAADNEGAATVWPISEAISYEIGGPSHGVVRAYFLDPTMYEALSTAAAFKTEDNKEYIPDLDFRHELIKKHETDADGEIYLGVLDVKVLYAALGQRFAVGDAITATGLGSPIGKVLAVEGKDNSGAAPRRKV